MKQTKKKVCYRLSKRIEKLKWGRHHCHLKYHSTSMNSYKSSNKGAITGIRISKFLIRSQVLATIEFMYLIEAMKVTQESKILLSAQILS